MKRNLLSVALASAIALCAADARAQAAAENANAETKEEAAKKDAKKPAELEQVTVVGIRSGIERAIDIKLESTSIVEAVSAEDIGKLPDVSIAESIARLPGLSAQRVAGRAQVISVRGLSPDFATTLLNGREMVSTGDNRSVEFDQYPSELLSGVTVYKTPDAALMGQGLSSTTDMQTVRPLNFGERAIVVNYRHEYTGKAEDKYVFKVPSMRNVARTAPYFHDGSVRSLEDAVRVMARVQLGQALSDATVADIVSFLDSLTGEPPSHYAPPTTLPSESTGAR